MRIVTPKPEKKNQIMWQASQTQPVSPRVRRQIILASSKYAMWIVISTLAKHHAPPVFGLTPAIENKLKIRVPTQALTPPLSDIKRTPPSRPTGFSGNRLRAYCLPALIATTHPAPPPAKIWLNISGVICPPEKTSPLPRLKPRGNRSHSFKRQYRD